MFCVDRNVDLTVLFIFHCASPRELDVPNTFISMLITLADLHDMSKRVAAPKTMRVKIQHALLAACSSAVSFFHAGIPGSVGSSDRYKPCALESAQPGKKHDDDGCGGVDGGCDGDDVDDGDEDDRDDDDGDDDGVDDDGRRGR